ncbi:type I-F CRISPR-associated protein Csy1 [Amphritea pacifica]|uniref:Type I-F CRISPR-associated protein Csy1 n=1 Tax=Amphritea pacifica TaxID=2811233 RepID=A0ABS2W7D9_9GAMM|nr:type I-F CRISPR-associated protein Csy1 [Amphritea pacifica]MBN0987632.1 type I-F CRISPR-associated protein Csy1 [Amphritea pacifica]
MHDAIKSFILERKDKKEESLLATKLVKDKDGGLNKILIKIIKSTKKTINDDLDSIAIRKKSKDETSLNFHTQKYHDLIALAEDNQIDIGEYKETYILQKQKVSDAHQFATWLDDNCKYAEGASVATHVSKLTHSSNKASCFFDQSSVQKSGYVTTSIIRNPVVDGAYDNALYSPIVSLLLVENEGRFFYEDIIEGKYDGLQGFEKSTEQLQVWKEELKKSIDKPTKSTSSLSKQIYFPVQKRPFNVEDWHLLSVLVSSSMAHSIFNMTAAKVFNDHNKSLRDKYRAKSLYSPETLISHPKTATLMVTQSSHQNTSQLNGARNGRLILTSSQPPTWQRQVKPPIYQTSWFRSGIPNYAVKEDIQFLREFLLRNDAQKLSTRDPKRRTWLVNWGEQIVDEAMYHANIIQTLPAGWSSAEDIKLKKSHQYFLDPYRDDEAFQAERDATEWEEEVCNDFSSWLNKRLQGKDNAFSPQPEHSKLWKSLMAAALRELKDTQKFSFEKEVNA